VGAACKYLGDGRTMTARNRKVTTIADDTRGWFNVTCLFRTIVSAETVVSAMEREGYETQIVPEEGGLIIRYRKKEEGGFIDENNRQDCLHSL
jgi:hypothetical protein